MKKLLFVLLVSLLPLMAMAQSDFSERTGKGFIERYSDPDVIHWLGGDTSFSWQSGYMMFAMEYLWKQTGNPLYFNYIKRYVDQHVEEDGNVIGFRASDLDNFVSGYAILFMYEQTGDEKYAKAIEKIRRGFDDYPRLDNGMFYHAKSIPQTWVDGVFMGQIFMARYAKTMNHPEDFSEVVRQITGSAALCDNGNGLLHHAWGPDGKSSNIWSEGMGWVAVLLADVFDYLPMDYPGADKVMDVLVRMCSGLKSCQDQNTGMWCQVVDCPTAPGNWNETSGTGMYIYLLQTAIDRGFIPKEEYQPVVDQAYKGILKKVVINSDGFINLTDCSSIGVMHSYEEYISQPREISTFAAYGSFILGTGIVELVQSR
jgi:rhamnogalacturonyl hydrolase YesR